MSTGINNPVLRLSQGFFSHKRYHTPRVRTVALIPYVSHSRCATCAVCGKAIAQVSGKGAGYYGCLSAAKGACENRLLVRRRLVERIILSALSRRILSAAAVEYVLRRVEAEVARLCADVPETIKLKQTELLAEERRVANFIEFIGEGRGSRALAEALTVAERRAGQLRDELDLLERSRRNAFQCPPTAWIQERLARIQEMLEANTQRSALLLRKVLGPIRLEPTKGDIGRPYYRAHSTLDVLALLNAGSGSDDPEPGSNTLREWRRGESNPRPEAVHRGLYVRSRVFCSRERNSHGQDLRSPARGFSSVAPEPSPPLIPICVA